MLSPPKIEFIKEYVALCKKHGFLIRGYGWEVDGEGVFPIDGNDLERQEKDLICCKK